MSSRLLSAVAHLQSAFEEARGYAKYHPSRGYWWDFSKDKNANSAINSQLANMSSSGNTDQTAGGSGENINASKKMDKKSKKNKTKERTAEDREETSSIFQRRRVDMLLDLWMRNFPPKVQGGTAATQATSAAVNSANTNPNTGNNYFNYRHF